jgi:hypothetical protein
LIIGTIRRVSWRRDIEDTGVVEYPVALDSGDKVARSVFANGGGAVSSNGSKSEKTISGVVKKLEPN